MRAQPATEIRTARLRLREVARRDLAAIVAGCSDPEVGRFIPVIPVPYSDADGRVWLAEAPQRWEDNAEISFALTEPDADELFGVVTARVRDGGSVGYWLAPNMRGHGLMAEAVHAVVSWAARDQGIRRLTLTTHPENIASQRTATRAGFRATGRIGRQRPYRDGQRQAMHFEWTPRPN